jgi:hypothetical protein
MPGDDGMERRAGDKSTAYGAAMLRKYVALLRAVTVKGT